MTHSEKSGKTLVPGSKTRTPSRWIGWTALLLGGLLLSGLLLLTLATALAYRNLPSIDALTDYQPKIPLRVYTADNILIGEFGEERRNVVRIHEVPLVLRQAILAAEDERFYEHGGVDYFGILRAASANLLSTGRKQGGSTITQQVARNFFLSSEQSYIRKFYEILLAFKIEANLSKDRIFEAYLNQIYLGQRAYGFASAARVYFGKPLSELTAAEAAMLAGLPKAPSAYNPVVNPSRARIRQQYVLARMHELRYLDAQAYKAALAEPLDIKAEGREFAVRAEYVAEMARQIAYSQYKEEAYTRGLNIYTTLVSGEQDVAYKALRAGVVEYVRRHGYGGPEAYIELPVDPKERDQAIDDALLEYPDSDDILAAIVLEATPKKVIASRQSEIIEVVGTGLKYVTYALSERAQPSQRIRTGAIVRLIKGPKGDWSIIQLPRVESALIAANVSDGAVRALVGGFDFNRGKFNHVTQAWRQPGSSFKPFIYSAALEKGLMPATVINDAPIVIDAARTGSQIWAPKNYDGKYEGPMTMRAALARSKNMVSIRVLEAIGPKYAQDYISRFGFDADKHPAYLTMALGAGAVTPWQMAGAFAVFANGGYKVNLHFISRITDKDGKVIAQAKPLLAGDEANRVIDVRNAFITDSMLRDVVRYGTAAKAGVLRRGDLAGKTGTTNDSNDAWFAGYSNGNIIGVTWMGYDQPRSLGDRETGGGLALPIWIAYMSHALQGVPEQARPVPEGIVQVQDDWYYIESQPGEGVSALGLEEHPAGEPETGTPGGAMGLPGIPGGTQGMPATPAQPERRYERPDDSSRDMYRN